MTDDIQNSVDVEVAPQEAVNEVSKAKEEAEKRDWTAMRNKNKDLEKRLKETEERFDKVLQNQMEKQAPPPEPDEFASIGDDEFIPKGQVQKLVEKQAKKYAEDIAKKEVEAYVKRNNDAQFMDKLNRQFSDFNEVVNPETLSLLEEREPELAKTIIDLKDPYKIGMQSYKYIKAMGIAEKAPEKRREKEIEKAIEKSEKTVQSPAAYDKRPIAQAFQLTDAMKKDLYREMNNYAAFASSVPELS